MSELVKVFGNDGFKITKNFLKSNDIEKLNFEIDQLDKNILFNGYSKGVVINSKVKYTHKVIYSPIINISSINLLEISIDVFKNIFNDEKSDYILTNLEIFIEKKNNKELNLHTDNRRGMVRAQIYLKGGQNNSGGFKYIKGTNLYDKVVEHNLSEEQIKNFKNEIIDLSGNEGDLISFDPWGYHGKNICIDERRTIMFEFQKKSTNYLKSSVVFNNLNITPKVLENIELFLPDKKKIGYNNEHGEDTYKNKYEVNFKILIYSFVNLIVINFEKKLKTFLLKIKNKVAKLN